MLNGAKLRELYYRVLQEGERPPPQADLMYLTGETRSNQRSVLNRASEFSGLIGIVGYKHTEDAIGYPGSDVWVPELARRGVGSQRIVLVKGSYVDVDGKQIIHTLSEMRALVQYAKMKGIRDIILVAPRFHILRVYMSAVLAYVEHYPKLKLYRPELQLYPALGTALDWDEHVSHSQGTLKGSRVDFSVEEIIRIYTYHAQGNLPDPETVLAYMDRLDTP